MSMSDPLVRLLKRVRKAHKATQAYVEECMNLPQDTYRHIERGRRALPDLRHDLVDWVQRFENCVDASKEERQEILEELSRFILEQFQRLLRDIDENT
jgi:transcriptional regulator with XRE-family HTH domain